MVDSQLSAPETPFPFSITLSQMCSRRNCPAAAALLVSAAVVKGVTLELSVKVTLDGKVLGIERRRRWSKDEKARIVEATLSPGAVVSEVARRRGAAQSLLLTWRRLARTTDPAGRDGSILLPVEIDTDGAAARPCRRGDNRARRRTDDDRSLD